MLKLKPKLVTAFARQRSGTLCLGSANMQLVQLPGLRARSALQVIFSAGSDKAIGVRNRQAKSSRRWDLNKAEEVMLTLFWSFARKGHVTLLRNHYRPDPRDGPVHNRFFRTTPLPSATIVESTAVAIAQPKVVECPLSNQSRRRLSSASFPLHHSRLTIPDRQPICRDRRSLVVLESQNPAAYNFWIRYFFDDPSPVDSLEFDDALRSSGLPHLQLAGPIGPARFRIMVMDKGRLAEFFPSGETRLETASSVSSGEETGDFEHAYAYAPTNADHIPTNAAYAPTVAAYTPNDAAHAPNDAACIPTNDAYVPTEAPYVPTNDGSSSAPAVRLASSG
ncbi:hypothetical protein BDK51DRAFT_39153 [Blyttiomyces helicus]|uniref:Uncharacterized protein n=1 Tax=Blyttiomyces helicus TaxID=388810 RepID=A0A4P9WHN7_9FUNG|nr:hypothetical protein BDK51DRAFT_39153 [Blyttiomyces helicus]|eukprot:RKO90620.1 hypothetical protein BDK51DRAFT_39153 [Blyttiomyces helicus]